MVTQANQSENAISNRAYELIADEIAKLGSVTDNGSTPKFGTLKDRIDPLLVGVRSNHWFRDNDTTSFEDSITSVIGHDGFRRQSNYDFNIIYDGRQKPAANADVIQIDVDGSNSNAAVVWMDDAYWDAWIAFYKTAWTNARLIDARHLTNGEIMTLTVLLNNLTTRAHASTRATPIIRATVEQCLYMIEMKATPYVQSDDQMSHPLYLPIPLWRNPKEMNDNQPADQYRAMAAPEHVIAGERVLKAVEGIKTDFMLAARLRMGV